MKSCTDSRLPVEIAGNKHLLAPWLATATARSKITNESQTVQIFFIISMHGKDNFDLYFFNFQLTYADHPA
jgi:hypothetical protein